MTVLRTLIGVTSEPPPRPLVSVLIPVRDEPDALARCLRSLAAQTYPHDRIEVLVAEGDAGRVEQDAALLRDAGLPGKALANPRRTTPCGLNVALDAARGEVIVLLGARAEVGPRFIEENVAALERTGADVVGGPVRMPAEGLLGRAVAAAMSSPFGVGDARYRYAESEGPVDTVNYGAYRRSVFERIGRFDESLLNVEDDELNYRLREAGGTLWLSPRIEVRYHGRRTLAGLARQYLRYGYPKVRVAVRHPGQLRARHLAPSALVAALGVGLFGAPWSRAARALLAGTAGAYALANLAASVRQASRQGWDLLPLLPAAYAAMHVCYGAGFLAGCVRFAPEVAAQLRRRREAARG